MECFSDGTNGIYGYDSVRDQRRMTAKPIALDLVFYRRVAGPSQDF